MYSTYLRDLVLQNRTVERKLERSMMIVHLWWKGKKLPENFQTEDQVRRRITGVKHHYKNKGTLGHQPGQNKPNTQ